MFSMLIILCSKPSREALVRVIVKNSVIYFIHYDEIKFSRALSAFTKYRIVIIN